MTSSVRAALLAAVLATAACGDPDPEPRDARFAEWPATAESTKATGVQIWRLEKVGDGAIELALGGRSYQGQVDPEARFMTFGRAAERALGVPALRTWRRTLVPAAVAPVATLGVLRVGRTLVTLAGLGFLGLGVPPPAAEWGGMIAAGRTYVRVAPWIVFAPGVAVVLATFAATTLASGFARAADPTLREGDT